MLRWLSRLLLWGLLIFAVVWVVSRLTNREEDFDDYDDIDLGLEFTETPVEIDVAAESATPASPSTGSARAESKAQAGTGTRASAATTSAARGSLIDVNGIGPTYAARLKEAGIRSLSDLAKADAGKLADKVEVIGGQATIEDWIKQAQEMTSSGAPGGE